MFMVELCFVFAKLIKEGDNIYELLNAAFEGFRRLFVLGYFVAAGANIEEA